MTPPLSYKRARAPMGVPMRTPARASTPVPGTVQDTGAGHFAGYASLFGQADEQNDVVTPGAFAAALAQRGRARIAMLYQHQVASPIGIWTALHEDAQGLWVEGRLALESHAGQEAYALLKAGALTGLSIGFHTVAATRRAGGGRVLRQVDLWEISLVTFPMLDTARVTQVKAKTAPAAGAFSHLQSTALARVMRRASAHLASPHSTGKGAKNA